jgi:hypothetical protein
LSRPEADNPSPYCFKIHFNIIFPSTPKYYNCSYSITCYGVKHALVCLVQLLGIREESVIHLLGGHYRRQCYILFMGV